MGRTEDTPDVSEVQICGLLGRDSLVTWEGETAFTQPVNDNHDAIESFLVGRHALEVDGHILPGLGWYWQRLEKPWFSVTRDVAPSASLACVTAAPDLRQAA